jgi:hypothetical protein
MRISILTNANGNNFISEYGIVAVLGDENQPMSGDTWRINCPLSLEKWHWDQM